MKRFWSGIRYSGIGVFFAGIVSVIQGCSLEREGALFASLLFLLQFCSGPVPATDDNSGSGGSASAPITEITMFSGGTTLGDMGGRAGADALCQAAANRPAGHTNANVRALISVDGTDEIRDMPGNYGVPLTLPIKGDNTGTTIAADWADLLDGTILATLVPAVVFVGATGDWWTGSDGAGELTASGFTCTGWTVTSGNGRNGNSVATNTAWLADNTRPCSLAPPNTPDLLCLAF